MGHGYISSLEAEECNAAPRGNSGYGGEMSRR